MSLPAGLGQGEMGGFTHRVPKQNMAVSGFGYRKALVGTGRAISILFGVNGL